MLIQKQRAFCSLFALIEIRSVVPLTDTARDLLAEIGYNLHERIIQHEVEKRIAWGILAGTIS